MPKLPVIKGKELIKFLESMGFRIFGMKGSHIRLKSDDGRAITVPLHENNDIPKGLLRKIIREDLDISLEDFSERYRTFKNK